MSRVCVGASIHKNNVQFCLYVLRVLCVHVPLMIEDSGEWLACRLWGRSCSRHLQVGERGDSRVDAL